jgi:hypothetical protein
VRVVIFVDQQNLYRSARDAYEWRSEPGLQGNALPLELGRLLTTGDLAQPVREGEAISDRDLVGVRVYMGQPSQRHDPHEYSRALRQRQHWDRSSEIVKIMHRTLRYPRTGNPATRKAP